MKRTGVLALLAILFFAPSSLRAADQFFEHSYAVVIGIDHYPSRMWPQLQYAVKDARAIAAYLRTQNYDQIITLIDEQATKQAIVAAMQNQLAPKLKSKDRVLIFFAGHGYTESLGGKDRGYLVPYDGDRQSAGYISVEELWALSDYMANARHQLFIMDSCYGGLFAVTRAGLVDPSIPDYLNNISDRVARQVITAGGKNQQVLDGGPKGHSYFVDYLLEALADGKADTNGDGYITFDELSSYLIPRASGPQQTPSVGYFPGHQAGEYLFRSPGRATPTISRKEPVSGPRRGAATEADAAPNTEASVPIAGSIIRKIAVSVLDGLDHIIPDISLSNFRIMENSTPQPIVDFHEGGSTAVAILVEFSTRLSPNPNGALKIASSLIDNLNPTDWASVSCFDLKLKILTDFSLDRAAAHTALNQLSQQNPAVGESNLFDALNELERRMKSSRDRKAIIVLSTGVDTFSKATLEETRTAVKDAGIPVFAIGLEKAPSQSQAPGSDAILQALVSTSGGQAFFLGSENSDQYATVLKTINEALHGYQISYRQTSPEQHSGLSNIHVDLVDPATKGQLKILDEYGKEIRYHIKVQEMP